MAEQENAIPRLSFLPTILGMVGPTSDLPSERLVLLNPFAQSAVVIRGGAGLHSAVLGGGAPPASKASIEALRAVRVEEEESSEVECAVCLERLFEKGSEEEEVVAKEMPCGHRFHGECVEKWLRMHGLCPLCRFEMPAEEGEGKKGEEEGGAGVWIRIRISFPGRDADARPQPLPASHSD